MERRPQRRWGTSVVQNAVLVHPTCPISVRVVKFRGRLCPILVGVDDFWFSDAEPSRHLTPPIWRFGKGELCGESSLRSTFFRGRVPGPSRGLRPRASRQGRTKLALLHRTSRRHRTPLQARGPAADSSRFADTRRRPFNLKRVVELSRCCCRSLLQRPASQPLPAKCTRTVF